MTLSPRDRRALALGAIGLAVICAARFLVIPWLDDWAAARERIAADRAQLNDMATDIRLVLGRHGRLAAEYGPAVGRPLKDLEAARVALLTAALDVLKANGFQPTEYQPRPDRPLRDIKGVLLVPLHVRGKCKIDQLAKCLAGMRKTETIVLVDRISATGDQKKPGELEVTMVLATLAEQPRAGS